MEANHKELRQAIGSVRSAWIIAHKELRLLFKSKRRVGLLFSMPIILLVVGLVIGAVGIVGVGSETSQTTVWVVDEAPSPYTNNLVSFIGSLDLNLNITYAPTTNTTALTQSPDFQVLLIIPANYSTLIQANQTAIVIIEYSNLESGYALDAQALAAAVETYDYLLVTSQHPDLNLNRVNPTLSEVKVTKGLSKDLAGIAVVIPMELLFFIVVPPVSLSLISVTMEREQKTLETLFLQPVSRKSIMFGKMLYGVILVLMTIILDIIAVTIDILIGIATISQNMGGDIGQIIDLLKSNISPPELFAFILGLFAVTLLLVAVSVMLSLMAKDEREANMLSSFILMLPVLALITVVSFPIADLPTTARYILGGVPVFGFMIAIYFASLQGGVQLLTWFTIFTQLAWVYLTMWLAARLSEVEGILDFSLKNFKQIFTRKRIE